MKYASTYAENALKQKGFQRSTAYTREDVWMQDALEWIYCRKNGTFDVYLHTKYGNVIRRIFLDVNDAIDSVLEHAREKHADLKEECLRLEKALDRVRLCQEGKEKWPDSWVFWGHLEDTLPNVILNGLRDWPDDEDIVTVHVRMFAQEAHVHLGDPQHYQDKRGDWESCEVSIPADVSEVEYAVIDMLSRIQDVIGADNRFVNMVCPNCQQKHFISIDWPHARCGTCQKECEWTGDELRLCL